MLEEQGIPQIEEREEGKYATRLHLTEDFSEGQIKCLLSCYDMGGHTEYYNSQQVISLDIAAKFCLYEDQLFMRFMMIIFRFSKRSHQYT